MNVDNLYKMFSRFLFFLALAGLAVAFIEMAAGSLGASILNGLYTTGRLIELSAALLIFVITILLRQIRDALRNQGSN